MNYLVLNGSPKKEKGVTMKITNKFIEGIKSVEPGANIDIFHLAGMDIRPCKSCYACWSHLCAGECVMTKRGVDDMGVIMEKYYAADKFILVTPMHFFNISSHLQKFLERTFPLIKAEYVPQNGNESVSDNVFVDMSTRDIAVISTCKVVFDHVWDCIDAQMRFLSKGKYQQIFSTQPFVLKPGDAEYVDALYKAVYKAGGEFAACGKFSQDTVADLKTAIDNMAANIYTVDIAH